MIPAIEGEEGLSGNESERGVGDTRLEARAMGKKIPERGTDVVKYRTLLMNQYNSSTSRLGARFRWLGV